MKLNPYLTGDQGETVDMSITPTLMESQFATSIKILNVHILSPGTLRIYPIKIRPSVHKDLRIETQK